MNAAVITITITKSIKTIIKFLQLVLTMFFPPRKKIHAAPKLISARGNTDVLL